TLHLTQTVARVHSLLFGQVNLALCPISRNNVRHNRQKRGKDELLGNIKLVNSGKATIIENK
ncbi:MAG: hypothetical protein FD167_5299, partial [bacterium]